jgi:hypothetical protein
VNKCRLCCENNVELLIDFGQQPIVHHLLSDKEESYLQYPFQLGYCSNCSFVQLLCPISGDVLYENYFSVSSWKNQPHVERLVDVIQLIAGINGHSNVLEIGCNDGSFIDVLSNRGIVNCTGIEPSKDAYDLAVAKGLNVHNTFFTIANCDSMLNAQNYDIIVCRHVLEHISDLHTFLEAVEFYLDDHGTFVIEIPDSSFNLEYMDYALWEEHVNYFTLKTVRNLLRKHGFRIVHHETTLFSGRALIVFAQKQVRQNDYTYSTADLEDIKTYGKNWEKFSQRMHDFVSSKKKVVIYGCGSRSSTFVNLLGLEGIRCYIDDQKEKQNYYVPKSKLQILPWSDSWSDAFFLLGVNSENERRVLRRREINVDNIASILPPSSFIPEFWKELYND